MAYIERQGLTITGYTLRKGTISDINYGVVIE